MLNIESAINDLGVNAIVAINLMSLLGVESTEFYDPQRFSRFQTVIGYLKQFPDDTQRFIITKATRGKLVDKLDHVFEYTNLLKQKFAQEELREKLKEEMSVLEATGDPKLEMTKAQGEEMDKQIERTLEEIRIYE